VRVSNSIPQRDAALAWLQTQNLPSGQARLLLGLAGGAPLAALALAEGGFLDQRSTLLEDMERLAGGQGDPLACAARWKPFGAERCLLWLQGWLNDMVVTAMQLDTAHLHNPDLATRLQDLEKRLDLNQLFCFADGVLGRALWAAPMNSCCRRY
jgi:DNA polymerase-3 subunit delta'